MAGQLDTLFKNVAKQVVADLGKSLDTTITYTPAKHQPVTTWQQELLRRLTRLTRLTLQSNLLRPTKSLAIGKYGSSLYHARSNWRQSGNAAR